MSQNGTSCIKGLRGFSFEKHFAFLYVVVLVALITLIYIGICIFQKSTTSSFKIFCPSNLKIVALHVTLKDTTLKR